MAGQRWMIAIVSLIVFALPGAHADAVEWTGEGNLSAATTSGNTDTTNIGLGVELDRETQRWKAALEARADFGETDGEETENRVFTALQLDRQIRDRLYGFARSSYERDAFSGFAFRVFAGAGLGYELLTGDRASWSIEGGPGVKIDKIEDRPVIANELGLAGAPGETVESVSFVGASNFGYRFNDAVKLTNDTDTIYAEESTQFANILAVTADLTKGLSARVSFEVRHDTNPPEGFESTDTASRVSIVYTFGE